MKVGPEKFSFVVTAIRIPLGEGGGWDVAIEPHVMYYHGSGESFHQAFVDLANVFARDYEQHRLKYGTEVCNICKDIKFRGDIDAASGKRHKCDKTEKVKK